MSSEEKSPAADRILDLLDGLANKLGIAANEIWKFTVKAKKVDAYRDIVIYSLVLIASITAWSWTVHVVNMDLPHETREQIDFITVPEVCDQKELDSNIKWHVLHVPCERTVEKKTQVPSTAFTDVGGFLCFSAIASAIAGLICLLVGIGGVIGSIADFYKIEYNAYDSIIRGLSGK